MSEGLGWLQGGGSRRGNLEGKGVQWCRGGRKKGGWSSGEYKVSKTECSWKRHKETCGLVSSFKENKVKTLCKQADSTAEHPLCKCEKTLGHFPSLMIFND